MIVHLYAACWNEADRLDAFFAHYDPWVTRYCIYDDGSDDGSIERLTRHERVTLRRLVRSHPESIVLSLLDLYNHAWKESRGEADWVVVVNIDEFVRHRDILGYLQRCRGIGHTVLPGVGFEVLPPAPPEQSPPWWGTPNIFSNKLAVFDPNAIAEIDYAVGRHSARPSGRVRLPPRDELLNLHFKYCDPIAALARMRAQRPRLGPLDLKNGWGSQYTWEEQKFASWLAALRTRAVRLDDNLDLDSVALPPRWWRPETWHRTPNS